MNRAENGYNILRLKNFKITAMLFSLIVLSGHFAFVSGQSSGDVWTFKEVRVFRKMDGRYGNVVREQFNINGGSVDIILSGNISNFCPGGTETLRFNWKFPDNISRLNRGGGFGVSLEAGQIGRSGTCQSAMAARSYLSLGECCYALFTDKDKEYSLLESGRIYSAYPPRAVPNDEFNGKPVGFAKVVVDDRVPQAEKTVAVFIIDIAVPTDPGGGTVKYVYIYERSGGTSVNTPISPPFSGTTPGLNSPDSGITDTNSTPDVLSTPAPTNGQGVSAPPPPPALGGSSNTNQSNTNTKPSSGGTCPGFFILIAGVFSLMVTTGKRKRF
ncbi:MAG TPA: hypothetical protein VF596_12980 [Pyrinomonadaceae bacterium]|jgi:hypothetical protein